MKTKKMFSKVFALLLAVVTVLAMSVTAFAQTADSGKGGSGSIEISNPGNGVEYKVYKVFDATYSSNGSIAYTLTNGKTTVPTTGFTVNDQGNVSYTGTGTTLSESEIAAVKAYVNGDTPVATVTSDGTTPLTITGLAYGYYYVTSSQGSVVTIDSTNPEAKINDKNKYTPVSNLSKTVGEGQANVNIGDTVTYTVKFKTANYDGTKQITEYTINDSLPSFMTDVTVTGITIGGADYKVNEKTPSFTDKKITIPWVGTGDAATTNLYANGAEIVITYTARVGADAAIAGEGNKNEVSITYKTSDGETSQPTKETAIIKTYAVAIQKVDDEGNKLAGATFKIDGVKASGDNGVYTVESTTATGNDVTTMTTDSTGLLIVKGLKANKELTVTEVAAPDGYNKLTAPVTVTPVETSATSTTTYLDADGNIVDTETKTVVNANVAATVLPVVNSTGSELPSTGGIGTTIFYVIGGILVAGAAITLIVRKRMSGYEG